jgi:hypothetical protein
MCGSHPPSIHDIQAALLITSNAVVISVGHHEFHVILDCVGPDGVWVGVTPPGVNPALTVGDVGAGWALHSDGDKRCEGREEEYAVPFKNGDVLTVSMDVQKVSVVG